MNATRKSHYTIPLDRLRMSDVEQVGGKNASLGEMISQLSGAGTRRYLSSECQEGPPVAQLNALGACQACMLLRR